MSQQLSFALRMKNKRDNLKDSLVVSMKLDILLTHNLNINSYCIYQKNLKIIFLQNPERNVYSRFIDK